MVAPQLLQKQFKSVCLYNNKMDLLDELSDEEYIQFLKSLGVETYGKSFHWLLNEPELSRVMKWLYRSLDQNNALTGREEYRYSELEKYGKLIPINKLEVSVCEIMNNFQDIPLPGDQDAVEALRLQISFQEETLRLLEDHERSLCDLVQQNKKRNEELNHELSKLNAIEYQHREDEQNASTNCMALAKEIENITEGIVGVIADTMNIYENTLLDKSVSQNFLTFGPFEAYRQSQKLFKSHFYLYTSKKFSKREINSAADKEAVQHLDEAKDIELKLNDCIVSYTNSVADLSGVQATLALVMNYDEVPPSKLAICTVENKASMELLEQESLILERQIQDAARSYVERRTRSVAEGTLRAALAQREGLYKDLCWLHDIVEAALSLDGLLYYATRNELQSVEDLVQFARDLKDYVIEEQTAVASRIDQMNNICAEQELCEQRLQSSNPLLDALYTMYEVVPARADGLAALAAKARAVQRTVVQLNEKICGGLKDKEHSLYKFESSLKHLEAYIWDGCTKSPTYNDETVSKLSRELSNKISQVEEEVVNVGSGFMSLKNGDKQEARKLWQWFLTDPAKLLSKLKEVGASM